MATQKTACMRSTLPQCTPALEHRPVLGTRAGAGPTGSFAEQFEYSCLDNLMSHNTHISLTRCASLVKRGGHCTKQNCIMKYVATLEKTSQKKIGKSTIRNRAAVAVDSTSHENNLQKGSSMWKARARMQSSIVPKGTGSKGQIFRPGAVWKKK